MRPIRILHVVTKMELAGTETLLMSYYKQVDRELVQFDFAVSVNHKCAYDDQIEQMGGRIFHYPVYKGYNHISYIKWWNKFFKEHLEISIVHGHIGSTAAIYLNIAKKYNRYTIAHSHSTWGEKNFHEMLYRAFSYPTRYIADYFLGCSKQALIDRYGNKVAKNSSISAVMPNAIDAKKFIYNENTRKEIRNELGIDDDMFVLGTVGRLTPAKNPYMTIRICQELVRTGVDFKFLWFGQGEMESELKADINRLHLNDKIIMAGVRKDIYNVLQAMDVFIFPSLWEGLGISCIEAQAAGLPTLCSEKIPGDANITNLFISLPLNNLSAWIDRILSNKNIQRTNRYDEIESAGYDIATAAKTIENFYKGISRR